MEHQNRPMEWNIVMIARPFPNPSIRSKREAHTAPWRNQAAIAKNWKTLPAGDPMMGLRAPG